MIEVIMALKRNRGNIFSVPKFISGLLPGVGILFLFFSGILLEVDNIIGLTIQGVYPLYKVLTCHRKTMILIP